jgi:ATP-dependent DNA helicase RecQ
LEEIAQTAGITFNELLTEIENISYSGTKLNLTYYLDDILDKTKQDDIHDYFMNANTDSLDEALNDASLTDYSEEDIRLIRVQFMSEHAH